MENSHTKEEKGGETEQKRLFSEFDENGKEKAKIHWLKMGQTPKKQLPEYFF